MKGRIGTATTLKGGNLPRYKEYDICPACNKGLLRLRNGKFGKFGGCSRYPKCQFTTTRMKGRGQKKIAFRKGKKKGEFRTLEDRIKLLERSVNLLLKKL